MLKRRCFRVRSLRTAMEGNDGEERVTDQEEENTPEQDSVMPRSRIEGLINAILQYQDVYPVLQRGVQFLCQELSEQITEDEIDDDTARCIRSFVKTNALVGTVNAMLANLDSPAFIDSCFELMILMANTAEEMMAAALRNTDILIIVEKIVHNVMYQDEPACVQRGIHILSKLAANLTSIESSLWSQLVAITTQAMLTNSLDKALALECVLTLKLLFQLKTDVAVPATSENVILKTLDQCNRQQAGVSSVFASAAVAVVFRIFDAAPGALRTSHIEFSAPILAAELHHYQLSTDLDHTHQRYVENLFQEPLPTAVHYSLTRLIDLALLPAESHSETQTTSFQSAAMKLVLGVVWRDEARAFLDSGGIAVLANVFASGTVLTNLTIEMALAQSMYYVSKHWPDETWNEIQVNSSGIGKWIELINERCNDGNDGLVYYFLAMVKTLLPCEEFREAFTDSNGAAIFLSVLHKHQQLPLCTRSVIAMIMSEPHICPADSLSVLCPLVAETMFALETDRLCLLECVSALTLLISQRCDERTLLSSQNVRDIVRVMRSKLLDCSLTVEMLSLVVNTLLNSSIRALFIDRGILQVVSKAICMHQWSPTEPAGSNARWIICDVAHKLDVSRNLSTLEPHAQISSEHSFNSPAISTEVLDTCCCMVGALASAKPLLPLLIEGNSIQCIVGMLRYAKQELILRSEGSFAQLVMTCFYTLRSIVNAPVVTQAMETTTVDATVDGRAVLSRLIDSGANDAIIGCLEEALRVKTTPLLLVDSGCRLLQAILAFPLTLSNEAESRWIAVATSILQRNSTQQRTRELLFATTLAALSRGRRSVETARGQHIKMMKVILEGLGDSIQHESSCTLLPAECTGAIRVLEEIAKLSGSLSDTLVSRCLGVLGKLLGTFILSRSDTAHENLIVFDNAVALFGTTSYINRLISRLGRFMEKEVVTETTAMVDMADDFRALKAILFSSQVRKTIDTYHRLFGYLATVVENLNAYEEVLGDHVPFFLELGCLASQLLPTARREEVINNALCQFAEGTAWHSMRWIAALADRGSSEFTLIVEFVLLRIVSGYTILESALLIELLDALNYLLRCSQSKEIVLASSHFRELQDVLWQLVRADLAHLEAESGGCDIAVSVLGIISILLSTLSEGTFQVHSEDNGSYTLVQFCLEALRLFQRESCLGLTKIALMEEVLQSTSIILEHCIHLGAEHVRSIIQHRATRYAANLCAGAPVVERKQCQLWYLVVLKAVIHFHGLLYAEKLLKLSSNPSGLLINLVEIIVQDENALSWKCFLDCVTMMQGSADTDECQTDCNTLFEKLRQQSMHLVHGQTTIINSRRAKKHITDTIAQLSLKYIQLRSETSQSEVDGCLRNIAQSGLAFYEFFCSASSFGVREYSAVVSLHLKIARLAGLKNDTGRIVIEESAVTLRQLLGPIDVSDEALANYIDLMAVMYLSLSVRAAAWLFTDASTNALATCVHRLTTGLARSPYLEKSLLSCFSSLRAVYSARWESSEVDSVLELLKICSPDKWSLDLLLESVLVLPQGLLHLFELARAAPSNDVHVIIMTFLFQHVNDIRHKTQRIGELELSAILSMVNRNLAGKVGDPSQRRWQEVTGSGMLESALETLKLFARRKNCAALCSDLGGINTLYNVLCAPSQYQDSIHLALEICCYLAGYGADLAHENATFAIQLLFVFVETNEDLSRSRLAFLVLEYVLAVGVSALTMPLIQQCRTQIMPASARSYEETEMFIQQLYITRQKFACSASKPKYASNPDTTPDDSLAHRIPLNENEIRGIITSSYRSIVQCSSKDDTGSYIDVNTSEKSTIEPPVYFRLREAIAQLGFVLDDLDMVMNRSYVSDLVPALCEILVLHTITTPMIYTIMQELDQIAFVNPSIVLLDKQVDFRALFASCSLHQRPSLQFARHLARFCNSIAADCQEFSEDGPELLLFLLPILLELLNNWKSDFEIVDLCLATAHRLIDTLPMEQFELFGSLDILALFNAAVLPYIGNSPTSWNWLKSVLAIVHKFDKLVAESTQDAISTVVGIIRMFISHSFMVEKALLVILRVYKEKRQLHLHHLVESDGVQVLLTCLKLHANDESIARTCLGLLGALVSQIDTSLKTIDQILVTTAAGPILLVCKNCPDNPLVCRMCINLVHRMVQTFENQSTKRNQMSALHTDSQKKKSELLTHLLEADIVPLLFDLLDNHSRQRGHCLLESILTLLKILTKDERMRESAEVLHGLQELQQTIDRVWEKNFDPDLVELAIDCLVNMACCDRALGHGWKELPMWLLQLAESIHTLDTISTGMCVEKLIGILGRLTLDSAICKAIVPKGSFIALEMLARVGEGRSLEQALFALLCTLCEDTTSAQILIVYDAIPITAERITCHIDDEETLLNSLCFFDLLVLNSGESYPALLDECVFEALELVVQGYPEISGGQMYRIASTILEKVSALDFQSTRIKPTQTKPMKALKPQLQVSESEKPFHDLLLGGATFRVLWEARPDAVERMQVKLAPSGDYLLFRRKAASQLPRIERIFVSQLEVCAQRSLFDQSKIPGSPSKKILTQSLLRENFEGDRVLRLKIRDEDVLMKTSSTRERVYWDQALQWLTSHRHGRTSPTHSPMLSR